MMLWSDNITRAPGEICLVKSAVLTTHSVSTGKKKFLTFSATTNAYYQEKKIRVFCFLLFTPRTKEVFKTAKTII